MNKLSYLKEVEIKFNKIQAALDVCNQLKLNLPEQYRAHFQELVDNDIKNRIGVAVMHIRVALEAKMEADIAAAIAEAESRNVESI